GTLVIPQNSRPTTPTALGATSMEAPFGWIRSSPDRHSAGRRIALRQEPVIYALLQLRRAAAYTECVAYTPPNGRCVISSFRVILSWSRIRNSAVIPGPDSAKENVPEG